MLFDIVEKLDHLFIFEDHLNLRTLMGVGFESLENIFDEREDLNKGQDKYFADKNSDKYFADKNSDKYLAGCLFSISEKF
jgi:hypothetical protein